MENEQVVIAIRCYAGLSDALKEIEVLRKLAGLDRRKIDMVNSGLLAQIKKEKEMVCSEAHMRIQQLEERGQRPSIHLKRILDTYEKKSS